MIYLSKVCMNFHLTSGVEFSLPYGDPNINLIGYNAVIRAAIKVVVWMFNCNNISLF